MSQQTRQIDRRTDVEDADVGVHFEKGDDLREGAPGEAIATKALASVERRGEKFDDPRALRHTFGQFATGVTVVTYEVDGEYFGATVNSFTSVSIDPPLLLVSFTRKSQAAQRLMDQPFTINVLAGDQKSTALQFAGSPQEGHEIEWDFQFGSPRIAGSLAHFSCTPWREYDGGDHVLFLGEVVDFGHSENKDSLVFYRGQWHNVAHLPPQVWLEWDLHGPHA
ncbi:flavin reductase family protein [Georgenia sp. Z1491]|uniref:flavin reductase family protein n=1 Tax=Georgenia sp. Z1491 TaxID=3416707 RepID=UPI003CF2BEE5